MELPVETPNLGVSTFLHGNYTILKIQTSQVFKTCEVFLFAAFCSVGFKPYATFVLSLIHCRLL
jgi:hypothetical protein